MTTTQILQALENFNYVVILDILAVAWLIYRLLLLAYPAEFLDIPRFQGADYERTAGTFLREKYARVPPDVIIAMTKDMIRIPSGLPYDNQLIRKPTYPKPGEKPGRNRP